METNLVKLTIKHLEQPSITTKELAYRWKLTVLTLERWRREGKGPQFSRKGRSVFYNMEDIKNYEESSDFKNIMDLKWKKSNPSS